MADAEFGTKFPELYLFTLEEITIDDETIECVLLDENVIGSTFIIFSQKRNVRLIAWLEFPESTHSISATSYSSSM
jgi:hypothetical protein